VTGFVAVGSGDEDARVDQQHCRTSDALSKFLAGGIGSLLVDVERLGPPGRAASHERLQGVIEPRRQLVEKRLAGDPATLSFGVEPGSGFFDRDRRNSTLCASPEPLESWLGSPPMTRQFPYGLTISML
jgi:hypothetical protein